MKRTPVIPDPTQFPGALRPLLTGSDVYDSSCSPTAQVWFVDRDGGYYIKRAPAGALAREALMGRYFSSLGLTAEVLDWQTFDACDWLLSRRVPGEDLTHAAYLSEPEWLCEALAEALHTLHALPTVNCPGGRYLDIYLSRAEANYRAGTYDKSHFPDSFGYRSAAEAWATLEAGRHMLAADTVIHGDFCLPNLLFCGPTGRVREHRLSGFIDLGNSGVADRHIDLFWGIWSLSFNLGTDRYRDRFLDAYGRERVDEDALRIVAAAEVFG